MKELSKNKIEYLGINIYNSYVSNIKKYYIWDNREFPIDLSLSKFLCPFDFGLRNNNIDFSISSFVKNADSKLILKCINLIKEKYRININSAFFEEFCSFQQFSNNIHYDPIVSFKYKNNEIEGVSFYVTALKDKQFVFEYMEQTISFLLNPSGILASFIKHMVIYRYADMFQIAWDFNHNELIQHKIYLKIKQLDMFVIEMRKVFPVLENNIYQEGYRFCELAFVIQNKEVKSFNLYFKPL